MQILLLGVSMPSFLGNEMQAKYSKTNSSSNKEQKKGDNNQIPNDEDESTEQLETLSFIKVIDQINSAHLCFDLENIESVKFVLYNSKDKVQFHPEFSTPPPKVFLA